MENKGKQTQATTSETSARNGTFFAIFTNQFCFESDE
jgi:hypothetical protein